MTALSQSITVLLVCVSAAGATDLASTLRRPVALAPSADGGWLYVANRDSGSLSIIDLGLSRVAAEHKIGRRLSDIATVPGTGQLLATDESAHDVVLIEIDGEKAAVKQRLAISPYPVSICLAPDGKSATIASLWSRRLTFVVIENGNLRTSRAIDLPFAPRSQLVLTGRNRLLVADAFGGKLALVDPQNGDLTALRDIPGHNVRGLGVSPSGEMLVIAHQMLNDLAHSVRNDIHWGLLMSNDLRWLKLDSVLNGGEHLYHGGHMHPLGESGRGAGDPGSLDVASDGTVVVALSGVNEVAFGKEGDFSMQRLSVGRRPTAVKFSTDVATAYIANTLDDSISVLDLRRREITSTISLGPSPDLNMAQRGELLFYDARLSHDGWMSCHSCHTDGHSNGQLNDNFSDRSFGSAKRVLSLLGVKDTLPLAWSGQVKTLEEQIQKSVTGTMQREDALASEDVAALAAYVKTLELPPPLDELRGTRDRLAVERGRLVFDRENCAACHKPPTFTSADVYDVGLHDAHGLKAFNPPSLRGASHRPTFLHDGRLNTLIDVFQQFRHPSDSLYSLEDIRDLAAFIGSL
jgi:DNA-binding beta-propeller fold protein YncE/mono/diheme cytochrome c family protein